MTPICDEPRQTSPAFPTATPDGAVPRRRPYPHGARNGDAMKRRWLVQTAVGEEEVEADEIEIMASGVLAFYRFQSRRENERTLLLALSPTSWLRCQLEGDD